MPQAAASSSTAIAATATFIAITCWWLTQDRSVPIYDAGAHLETALNYHNMIAAGNLFGPLKSISVYPIFAHIVGALAMFVLVDGSGSLIATLLHRHDTEQAIALLKDMKTLGERTFFFLLACAFAPFYEELAFRAFVFNALTRYTSIGVAATVSGILFGLLHASSPPELLTVGVPLALGGFVLAYVYAYTRCFWANVFTHALFNAISTVSIFLFHVS